jgi:PEP-CTERM motif
MRKFMMFATPLVALLIVAAPAVADNLLFNGSFEDGNFNNWLLGTTQFGSPGQGFPIVTTWPLGGMNAAEYEVGETESGTGYQGATLSQEFTTSGGSISFGFMYAAMGDGIHHNADGGLFELLLDGVVLNSFDVGAIDPNQIINGTLTASAMVSAGEHDFQIDILRPYLTDPGNTPYQYVTDAYANGPGGTTPEPGTFILLGTGLLGILGFRKRV